MVSIETICVTREVMRLIMCKRNEEFGVVIDAAMYHTEVVKKVSISYRFSINFSIFLQIPGPHRRVQLIHHHNLTHLRIIITIIINKTQRIWALDRVHRALINKMFSVSKVIWLQSRVRTLLKLNHQFLIIFFQLSVEDFERESRIREMYKRRFQNTPNKPATLYLPRSNTRFPDLNPSPTLVSHFLIEFFEIIYFCFFFFWDWRFGCFARNTRISISLTFKHLKLDWTFSYQSHLTSYVTTSTSLMA